VLGTSQKQEKPKPQAVRASTTPDFEEKDEEVGPILEAARRGRWVEAHKELRKLREEGRNVDSALGDAMVERITRIGNRFAESLEEIDERQDDNSWTRECDAKTGLHYSFRLANNTFQVVASENFEGFDALQAFVALCEFDLCGQCCRDITSVECVSHERINDSIWRLQRHAQSGREDNIVQVSTVDALDEQIGCLWLCAYTPTEEQATSLLGFPLPQPEEGAVRVGLWRIVYVVTPIWDEKPSFRLTVGLCRRPTSAACIFPGVIMRREVGTVLRGFRSFLEETCKENNWRSVFSRKAPFYDDVRRHLVEKNKGAPLCQPLLGLTFPEISSFLPEGWADDVEGLVQMLGVRREIVPSMECGVRA